MYHFKIVLKIKKKSENMFNILFENRFLSDIKL